MPRNIYLYILLTLLIVPCTYKQTNGQDILKTNSKKANPHFIYYELPPTVDSLLILGIANYKKQGIINIHVSLSLASTDTGSTYSQSHVYDLNLSNYYIDGKQLVYKIPAYSNRLIKLSNGDLIPVVLDDFDYEFVEPEYKYIEGLGISKVDNRPGYCRTFWIRFTPWNEILKMNWGIYR